MQCDAALDATGSTLYQHSHQHPGGMDMRIYRLTAALALGCVPIALGAGTMLETSAGPMLVTEMATGLDEPWAIGFLPDGDVLITERAGRLVLLSKGQRREVGGLPDVYAEGQGGLLDIMVPMDFAASNELWFTYAEPGFFGGATAVGKGILSPDRTELTDFQNFIVGDKTRSGNHFGSRLVEAADGTVFVTFGDRGTGPDGLEAQDPTRIEGKVLHLTRDGIPATALPGYLAGVYSIGHRNPQGLTVDADGALWLVEHGAQGGDELNLLRPGRNYGWPVISYGEKYGGGQIGIGNAKDGMEQPLHYWVPSIAPSGLMIYSGKAIADWKGDIFTGSLNSDFISRLDPDQDYAEDRISAPETGRVRDVVEAPDGSIWFLSVSNGAAYRLAPAP